MAVDGEYFEIDEPAFPVTSAGNFGMWTFAYLSIIAPLGAGADVLGYAVAGTQMQGLSVAGSREQGAARAGAVMQGVQK